MAAAIADKLAEVEGRRVKRFFRAFTLEGVVGRVSSDALGLLDLAVACPLHNTINDLVSAGMHAVRFKRLSYVHRAFHLSVRPSPNVLVLER